MEYKKEIRKQNKLRSEKTIKELEKEILEEKERINIIYWINLLKENYPNRSEELNIRTAEIVLSSYVKEKRLVFLEKRLEKLNRIEKIKTFCTYDENGFRCLSDDLEKEWSDIVDSLTTSSISEDMINILNYHSDDSDY